MRREIRFRGLRVDGKGWVYGDLVRDKHLNGVDTLFFILTEEAKTFDDVIPVVSETVGQFTELKDRNKNDIYEGDTVNCYGHIGVVTFINGCFVLVSNTEKGKSISKLQGADSEFDQIEIISNIHQQK